MHETLRLEISSANLEEGVSGQANREDGKIAACEVGDLRILTDADEDCFGVEPDGKDEGKNADEDDTHALCPQTDRLGLLCVGGGKKGIQGRDEA